MFNIAIGFIAAVLIQLFFPKTSIKIAEFTLSCVDKLKAMWKARTTSTTTDTAVSAATTTVVADTATDTTKTGS